LEPAKGGKEPTFGGKAGLFNKWIPQKMFAVDNETSVPGFLEVLTQ